MKREPRFSDLEYNFDTGGMVSTALNFGASSPIDVRVEGGALEDGIATAKAVKEIVERVPGAADVHVQQRTDAPLRTLEVDRQKAADLGLSEFDVVSQVVTAMNSSVSLSRNFWVDS